MTEVRFNQPYLTGRELDLIQEAQSLGRLAGNGAFTRRCETWLETHVGCHKALLTHSCTAALEMAALLLDLKPGDEVIMPSFTFVSTANAFVLRGAVPVFVDIRPDTLNINESLIEAAITPRTRAICVVHYAGVACEMDTIIDIAKRHGLSIVEDAAQAIMSSYKGRPLGNIGDFGTLSFHETKNVISGEGGALLINREQYADRAEFIHEKGTNRSNFYRGHVDKYTWVDVGSSYLPGEITAAFLAAQLDQAREITARRLSLWRYYHNWAERFENKGLLRRPTVPEYCNHNAHMYYLLLRDGTQRDAFINHLRSNGIRAVFHYIPLHSSPAGKRHGTVTGSMQVTDKTSTCIVRMPLWIGLEKYIDYVCKAAESYLLKY